MTFRIRDFEIRPDRREIVRGGRTVRIEPKLFDMLLLLAERGGAVVSKEELVRRVWNGRAISDDAITSALRDLRAALGDDGRRQEVIRTVYGRGLRLAVPVEPLAPAAGDSADWAVGDGVPAADPSRPSITVLPLRPLDDGDAALCRAATVDLTIALARTRWLFVSSHHSLGGFAGGAMPAEPIARRLGVRYVLSGSLARQGRKMRLSLLLTDTREGRDMWGATLTRTMEDVCAVMEEVARTVAAGVETEIALSERSRALLTPMADLDAWTAYHRAMALLYRFSAEHLGPAAALLERAARLDPGAARIRAAQSFLEWQRAFLEQGAAREQTLSRTIAYAREAIALDPADPQGHWALGRAHILDGQVARAEASLRTAVGLNPSFANAYYSMAWSLSQEPSRRDDSQRTVESALRLSPLDPMIYGFHILEADLAYFRGEYPVAIDKALQAASHPWAHHHVLAIASWVLEASGAPLQARVLAADVRRRKPGYDFADYCAAVPVKGEKRRMVADIFRRLEY